jgi:ubiquinone/menaquinone biosynthesis C-methylase UbiE
MSVPENLTKVLAEKYSVKPVEDDIYSVLPDSSQKHQYDKMAALYDLMVGTRLYNRLMWGASLAGYVSFVEQALDSNPNGIFLDAGCGSLLFTAKSYLKNNRPIIAFDQSLSMLQRARQRLLKLSGSMPKNIVLLQADATDLPLQPASFQTILCLNVLHHLENVSVFVQNLKKLLQPKGGLYLTSLVLNQRFIGDRYLSSLHQAGEVVRPRRVDELKNLLDEALEQPTRFETAGNMAFISINPT